MAIRDDRTVVRTRDFHRAIDKLEFEEGSSTPVAADGTPAFY
jgi:ATP-dependent 26S proteasome regulatory subunit